MALIADIAFYIFTVAFLSGLLITTASGSVKAIKIYLALLTILALISLIIGLIASRGMLTFLLFQLITLVIIIFFVIIAGAAVGGGIYSLIHRKSSYKKLTHTELKDYLSLTEFANIEGITEERALARIKNGFYTGGTNEGCWYINKAELSGFPEKKKSVDKQEKGETNEKKPE